MNELYCNSNCCKLTYKKNIPTLNLNYNNKNKKKAGVLYIVDQNILIIQSRGNLWGIPKGSLEKNETFKAAAVREFKEETNIEISEQQLEDYIRIDDCSYYILTTESLLISLPELHSYDSVHDVTGIGFVNINCIQTLKVRFTSHFKILLKIKFNIVV